MKKLIKTGDMILIVFILAIAIGLLLIKLPARANTEQMHAQILIDGDTYMDIDLSQLDEEEVINARGCTIIADRSGIRFTDADCPDKICVHSGKLTKPGDMAACVPNKTMIRIVGSEEMDAITY